MDFGNSQSNRWSEHVATLVENAFQSRGAVAVIVVYAEQSVADHTISKHPQLRSITQICLSVATCFKRTTHGRQYQVLL